MHPVPHFSFNLPQKVILRHTGAESMDRSSLLSSGRHIMAPAGPVQGDAPGLHHVVYSRCGVDLE